MNTATAKEPEFAAILSVSPLFANLGADAIRKLAALCQRRPLDAGEVLLMKGDDGDALFGVRRGQIQIETGTAKGGRLTLNVLGSGDLFGEVALLDGQPRTADAVAAEASELFILRRSDFLNFLESEPKVAIRVIELLCQRVRWISERMEETALMPLQARLARRLCALAEDFGSELTISQEQLGIYVGAARESVNRQLQDWQRAGIVELRRGRIGIRGSQEAHDRGEGVVVRTPSPIPGGGLLGGRRLGLRRRWMRKSSVGPEMRDNRRDPTRDRSSIIAKNAGTNRSDRNVETIRPPMTAIAIGERNSPPAPSASALGAMPATIATVVIMIGRARFCPASTMAVVRSMPACMDSIAKSTSMIAFLVTMPISIRMPMTTGMLIDLPAMSRPRSRRRRRAAERTGW